MTHRRTVLLLIPHLGGGGAERVIENLVRGLNREKYDVHLGVLSTHAEQAAPPVPTHLIGVRRVRYAGPGILRLAWQLRPDVILSGIAHLNFLVLLLLPFLPRRCKILVRQNGWAGAKRQYRFLYRWLYPTADAVICQSHAMAAEFAALARCKTLVLPNPVDIDQVVSSAQSSQRPWAGPGPHLVGVARLRPEKRFDLLLKALAIVRREFPTADLTIVGDGARRIALEDLAKELGLTTAVRFAGYDAAAAAWFSGATVYVLTSQHEGLPNALLEAAAAGMPIVSTPASHGIVELLNGDPGAWLARDGSAEGIAAAIQEALAKLQPGQRFAHPWVEQFRLHPAISAYEGLIDQCLRENARR